MKRWIALVVVAVLAAGTFVQRAEAAVAVATGRR